MKSNKISEQDKIQAANLLEEAKAIMEPCIKCGLCKSKCPTFKAIKEERISPRGLGILITNNILDSSIFECTLCKACDASCPLDIKISEAIQKAREAAVLLGKGTKANEEIVKDIMKKI